MDLGRPPRRQLGVRELPAESSEDIRELVGGARRGFGSVRVRVTVGGTTWSTSIFPDSTQGCYVLPVKRAVRKAESLEVGDVAAVTVELVDFSVCAPTRTTWPD